MMSSGLLKRILKFGQIDLSKIFLYLLIIFLPVQTRKIFFTDSSDFFGYHVFYNTLYLYLTDILFFGLILVWFLKSALFPREKSQIIHKIVTRIQQDSIYRYFLVFWLILGISVIFSRENILALYGFAKITQFLLIFAYVRENVNFSREKTLIFSLIVGTFTLQSIIGIVQYVGQSSLGLTILGEEFLRPGLRGIAEFSGNGVLNPLFYDFFPYLKRISNEILNMRAYGTLPHPNVLAGLLFAGLMTNLYLVYFSREKWAKLILGVSFVCIFTGLIATFSRFAWVAVFFAVVFWFFLVFVKIRRPALESMRTGSRTQEQISYFPGKVVLITILVLISVGFNIFWFGSQVEDRIFSSTAIRSDQGKGLDQSLVDRQTFNSIALNMIGQEWVLGVGWKNFVVVMDDFSREKLLPFMHQPVHNIFLLIAAEAGIFALAFFVLAVYNIVRRSKNALPEPILRYTLLIILGGFLGLGLTDHYTLTIQQGSLIFWLTLGFLANQKGAAAP